jgi:hypothetical protein
MSDQLVHREDLLADLAYLAERHLKLAKTRDLASVEVELVDTEGEVVLETDFGTALHYVVGCLYWNEESDWRHANHIRVSKSEMQYTL